MPKQQVEENGSVVWPKVSYISTSDTLQQWSLKLCTIIVATGFLSIHFLPLWWLLEPVPAIMEWEAGTTWTCCQFSKASAHRERDNLSHLWATGMSFDPCGKTWRLRPQPAGGLKSWMSLLWGCSAYHHTTFLHSGMMVILFQSNRIRDIKVQFGCL